MTTKKDEHVSFNTGVPVLRGGWSQSQCLKELFFVGGLIDDVRPSWNSRHFVSWKTANVEKVTSTMKPSLAMTVWNQYTTFGGIFCFDIFISGYQNNNPPFNIQWFMFVSGAYHQNIRQCSFTDLNDDQDAGEIAVRTEFYFISITKFGLVKKRTSKMFRIDCIVSWTKLPFFYIILIMYVDEIKRMICSNAS